MGNAALTPCIFKLPAKDEKIKKALSILTFFSFAVCYNKSISAAKSKAAQNKGCVL